MNAVLRRDAIVFQTSAKILWTARTSWPGRTRVPVMRSTLSMLPFLEIIRSLLGQDSALQMHQWWSVAIFNSCWWFLVERILACAAIDAEDQPWFCINDLWLSSLILLISSVANYYYCYYYCLVVNTCVKSFTKWKIVSGGGGLVRGCYAVGRVRFEPAALRLLSENLTTAPQHRSNIAIVFVCYNNDQPGASVVDCIVWQTGNVSIQMSYNMQSPHHGNNPLNNVSFLFC